MAPEAETFDFNLLVENGRTIPIGGSLVITPTIVRGKIRLTGSIGGQCGRKLRISRIGKQRPGRPKIRRDD